MPLKTRRQAVLQRIRRAESQSARPSGSVSLLAVGKTFPAEDIRALYRCGQRDFGENYIREWQEKARALSDCPDIVWHIIGHVQSNKSRAVAEGAHWLHTLDRVKLAERLSAQRPPQLPPLQLCIEINISGESAKHGIRPEELPALAQAVSTLPRLNLRGLMCVAQAGADEIGLRRQFSEMGALLAVLRQTAPQADTLSMGMSSDMDSAIACGATIVRVGSAIFGRRDGKAA